MSAPALDDHDFVAAVAATVRSTALADMRDADTTDPGLRALKGMHLGSALARALVAATATAFRPGDEHALDAGLRLAIQALEPNAPSNLLALVEVATRLVGVAQTAFAGSDRGPRKRQFVFVVVYAALDGALADGSLQESLALAAWRAQGLPLIDTLAFAAKDLLPSVGRSALKLARALVAYIRALFHTKSE